MHTTPYLTEPFSAISVAIDSKKSNKDRIHAVLGVIDYGVIAVMNEPAHRAVEPEPEPAPAPVAPVGNPLFLASPLTPAKIVEMHASKDLDTICSEIKATVDEVAPPEKPYTTDAAHKKEMKAIDFSKLWQNLGPLMIALLQRLLVS